MTLVRINFLCALLFVASIMGVMRAPAAPVQYDTATGQVIMPTTGMYPKIYLASYVTHGTDADYTAVVKTSYVEWNVPSQSQARSLTLPAISDTGFVPGRTIEVMVTDANGEAVNVLDEGANYVAFMSTGERYQFTARADGFWVPVNLTWGTAAYVNTGTGSGNVPTVSQADARYVGLAGAQTITGAKTFTAPASYSVQGVPRSTLLNGEGGLVVENGADTLGVVRQFYHALQFGTWQSGTGMVTAFDILHNSWINMQLQTRCNGGLTVGGGTLINNLRYATATLTGGTVTVSDSAIGSTDHINPVGIGTTNAGALSYTINAGVGYTIYSTNGSDARAISIQITDLP